MFIQLFCFLLCMIHLTECKIEIRDANVAALSRDEIGMNFYITIQNGNLCPYEVKVHMLECTEVLTEVDRDSSFMYLLGGHMGVLKPHCYKNITVIYPNMYLHNRRGFCLISIKFKSAADEIIEKKANVSFDTYIYKHGSHVLRGYYNKNEVSSCKTPDQDPLNRCKPVDCPMKYLGTRNYFSKHQQRCQRVPICISDPKKDMPDTIYSPTTNKCRDMETTVSKGDLHTIESGMAQPSEHDNYHANSNIDCHFGKYNNKTGSCDCHSGWTSPPVEKDRLPSNGLFTYHMCNIESSDWYDTDSRKLKLVCLIAGILAVLLAMVIILCSFLIQLCYNCIKSFEESSGEEKPRRAKHSKSNKIKNQLHKATEKVLHPRRHSRRSRSHRSRSGSRTSKSERSGESSKPTTSEPSSKSHRHH